MKELKSILGLLVLLVGGFVMYKVVPVYWGDFKLGRLLEEQAQFYTYYVKSDKEMQAAIAQKAQAMDVPVSPEQLKIERLPGVLSITADYSVHIDLPLYPFDLNFKTTTRNKDVMK
jgi:hypothetical protein